MFEESEQLVKTLVTLLLCSFISDQVKSIQAISLLLLSARTHRKHLKYVEVRFTGRLADNPGLLQQVILDLGTHQFHLLVMEYVVQLYELPKAT